MMSSKIHSATVTEADLNYEGSISIDKKLLEEAGMLIGQQVDVLNVNNGERFTTYTIIGKKGEIKINGAAARKVQVGDKVIIIAYAAFEKLEALSFSPKVLVLDEKNQIKK
jgi:aspartate 1-decarboxylase